MTLLFLGFLLGVMAGVYITRVSRPCGTRVEMATADGPHPAMCPEDAEPVARVFRCRFGHETIIPDGHGLPPMTAGDALP